MSFGPLAHSGPAGEDEGDDQRDPASRGLEILQTRCRNQGKIAKVDTSK
jgi:hypothetical protein